MVLGYKQAATLPPGLPHEPPVEPGEVKVPLNDGTELHYTFHEVEPLKVCGWISKFTYVIYFTTSELFKTSADKKTVPIDGRIY